MHLDLLHLILKKEHQPVSGVTVVKLIDSDGVLSSNLAKSGW